PKKAQILLRARIIGNSVRENFIGYNHQIFRLFLKIENPAGDPLPCLLLPKVYRLLLLKALRLLLPARSPSLFALLTIFTTLLPKQLIGRQIGNALQQRGAPAGEGNVLKVHRLFDRRKTFSRPFYPVPADPLPAL